MYWLLGVQILRILDIEAKEITELGCGVDFGLPCVFPLPEHCCCHYLITVFSTDQVGSFEEDGGSVGEGEGFPCWLGHESGVNGSRDVGGAGVGVFGNDVFVVGGICLIQWRCFPQLSQGSAFCPRQVTGSSPCDVMLTESEQYLFAVYHCRYL